MHRRVRQTAGGAHPVGTRETSWIPLEDLFCVPLKYIEGDQDQVIERGLGTSLKIAVEETRGGKRGASNLLRVLTNAAQSQTFRLPFYSHGLR